jgi:hypothetical protein
MKRSFAATVIGMVVVLCAATACKEEKSSQSQATEHSQTSAVVAWREVPNIDTITNERTIGIKEVVSALDVRVRAKDQFETEADYERRVAEAKSSVKVAGHDLSHVFAFELKPGYDIDRRAYVVNRDTRPQVIEQRVMGSYRATNGYGAQVEVTQKEVVDYTVRPTNPRTVTFQMGPDEARNRDQHLRVWFFVRFFPPYLEKYKGVQEASFRNPVEETSYSYYVQVENVEAWLVDVSLGKVIARYKFEY